MTDKSQNLELKRFARDNLIVLIRIIVSTILAIGLTIIIGRTLGTEGKGLYELSLYLPTLIVTVIFNFGIPLSITYHIARKDFDLNTSISAINFVTVILSLAGILFGVIIIFYMGTTWFSNVPKNLLYGTLALIPVMFFVRHGISFFRGLEEFRIMGFIETFQPLIALLSLLLILIFLNINASLALVAVGIGYAIASVLVIFFVVRFSRTMKSSIPRFNYYYIRNLFSHGFQIYGTVIVANLLLRADVLLLNIWGQGITSIGLYSVAVTIVERVWTLSSFNSSVLMPRVASWKDDKERQGQITFLSTKYSFWLGVLATIAMIILGRPFIHLTVGKEFDASFFGILSLLPGVVFYNLAQPIGASLVGSGQSWRVTIFAAIALILNVLLNFAFIPRYDFIGAGLASSIAYFFYGIVMLWDFSRRYNIAFWSVFVITHDDIRRIKNLIAMVKLRVFDN